MVFCNVMGEVEVLGCCAGVGGFYYFAGGFFGVFGWPEDYALAGAFTEGDCYFGAVVDA